MTGYRRSAIALAVCILLLGTWAILASTDLGGPGFVHGLVAAVPRDSRQVRKSVLDQHKAAAGRRDQIGAASKRAWIAVDADHAAFGGGEDFTRIAAAAEGCVDVDAALADRKEFDRAAGKHGNVTSRSASDSAFAVAARHHSRAPCGGSAATQEPSCRFNARTFSVASASSAPKRFGSQI